MTNAEMIQALQSVLDVLPNLQCPAFKVNLQIMLMIMEQVEKVRDSLKACEETKGDDQPAVSAEEI